MTSSATVRSYSSPRLLERQEIILSAAREELAEKGYDHVTMDGLAKRAGVARRTLYNKYGSKDELMISAISELITRYHEVPDSERGLEAILSSRQRAVDVVLASQAYAEAMTIALYQAACGDRLIDLLLENAVGFAAEHLQIEHDRGQLRPDISVRELAVQVAGQAWGQIILNQKRVTPIQEFRKNNLLGLLLLLESATQGDAYYWVVKQRKQLELNVPHRRGNP